MICLTFWRLFGLLVAVEVLARLFQGGLARFFFRRGRWKI